MDSLTGIKFGKLTVLDKFEITKDSETGRHETYWECICDCGNICKVRARSLKNGNTVSCGCYRKEHNINNLSGKHFGMLTVIGLIGINKNRKCVFLCRCKCGNIIEIVGGNLSNGKSKSCGCQSESQIATNLKKYFCENYGGVAEYNELKNPKTNRFLPFDIFIKQFNIYVEIQGIQHYRKDNYFTLKMAKRNNTSLESEFENRKFMDCLKRKHAEDRGVYIEIDLRKILTTKRAIDYIEYFIEKLD